MQDEQLNPLQQHVLESLRIPDGWHPLDPSVIGDVESMLKEALSPLDGRFTREKPLRVNKHGLATVHGCERHHVAQKKAPFAWTVNTVRGTIVHKAIELLLNWSGPVTPADIVDEAISSIAQNQRESASEFLDQLPPAEMAELRGVVVGAVTNFVDCFPPIKRTWRPLVEYTALYSLFGQSVQFNTRMDLVLGRTGSRVIIDLKTGRISPVHREDLRFYALVDTLRSRQAPRKLGSYSLDSARLEEEDVTEGVLQAAVRRTADGAIAIAQLELGDRQPTVRPGVQCRWCPVADSCEEGQRELRALSGDYEED